MSGDRRGQRASRPMIAARKPFPAIAAHQALPRVEVVAHQRGVFVRAGQQYVLTTELDQPFGACGERNTGFVFLRPCRQSTGFDRVGGEYGTAW